MSLFAPWQQLLTLSPNVQSPAGKSWEEQWRPCASGNTWGSQPTVQWNHCKVWSLPASIIIWTMIVTIAIDSHENLLWLHLYRYRDLLQKQETQSITSRTVEELELQVLICRSITYMPRLHFYAMKNVHLDFHLNRCKQVSKRRRLTGRNWSLQKRR